MPLLAAFVVPHPPIILPEVGRGEENKIEMTTEAYLEVMSRIAALRPDTIVLTSPHSIMYSDYFHISPGDSASGDLANFRAGNVRIKTYYDVKFTDRLSQIAEQDRIPAGVLGERDNTLDHGTMIPLYFLNKFYTDYKIVRIGLSGLSQLAHYRLGQCIAKTADELDRRVVIIASGDLSHKLKVEGPYGFAPEGPELDNQIVEALGNGDFLKLLCIPSDLVDAGAECGLRSFHIMAGALDRKAVTQKLLSYEGPFGVGYCVASFDVIGNDETRNFGEQFEVAEQERLNKQKEEEDEYVRLARLSLETFIKTGKRSKLPEILPDEMLKRSAGTFVSLKKHGQLRGCIGTISATKENIAQEIINNAISAAVNDPRFDPITADELAELVYSVDVLGDTEKISSTEQLDVKRYGVIVEKGNRRGLLLPNLEGVDTVEQQISIAKQKGGISPDENVSLQRFEVVRHK